MRRVRMRRGVLYCMNERGGKTGFPEIGNSFS